jgi:hypothetical protein
MKGDDLTWSSIEAGLTGDGMTECAAYITYCRKPISLLLAVFCNHRQGQVP